MSDVPLYLGLSAWLYQVPDFHLHPGSIETVFARDRLPGTNEYDCAGTVLLSIKVWHTRKQHQFGYPGGRSVTRGATLGSKKDLRIGRSEDGPIPEDQVSLVSLRYRDSEDRTRGVLKGVGWP